MNLLSKDESRISGLTKTVYMDEIKIPHLCPLVLVWTLSSWIIGILIKDVWLYSITNFKQVLFGLAVLEIKLCKNNNFLELFNFWECNPETVQKMDFDTGAALETLWNLLYQLFQEDLWASITSLLWAK